MQVFVHYCRKLMQIRCQKGADTEMQHAQMFSWDRVKNKYPPSTLYLSSFKTFFSDQI